MNNKTDRSAAARRAERGLPTHYRDAAVTGQVKAATTAGPPIFYTDGSVSGLRFAGKLGHLTGWGYLALDGRYGCGRYPQFSTKAGRDVPLTTELRAVWHAVGDLLADQAVTVITDSNNAAAVLNRWKTGSTDMFAGYTGSSRTVPTLEKLRRVVAAHPGHLTVETIAGQSGDPLNEGADTLAMIAMRWARDNVDEQEIRLRAARTARDFLADWRRRQ